MDKLMLRYTEEIFLVYVIASSGRGISFQFRPNETASFVFIVLMDIVADPRVIAHVPQDHRHVTPQELKNILWLQRHHESTQHHHHGLRNG